MEDVEQPVYYRISRKATEEEIERALDILSLTPIGLSIFSEFKDAGIALKFSQNWVCTNGAALIAFQHYEKTKTPAMVVGDADFMEAVYADGRREAVARG